MKDYKGKVCGITGAASGIGKAFALYAAEQGMRLAPVSYTHLAGSLRVDMAQTTSLRLVGSISSSTTMEYLVISAPLWQLHATAAAWVEWP